MKSFGQLPFFAYFCNMKTKRKQPLSATHQSEADIFRQKADHYLICFNDLCPRREQCLRWLAGCHIDPQLVSTVSVNLRNRQVSGEQCNLFRPKMKVAMKRGLTLFYVNMTGSQERMIRRQLIDIFNRKVYYQLRNGRRLINPEQQQVIEQVCRSHGWNGPFQYDGEELEYNW